MPVSNASHVSIMSNVSNGLVWIGRRMDQESWITLDHIGSPGILGSVHKFAQSTPGVLQRYPCTFCGYKYYIDYKTCCRVCHAKEVRVPTCAVVFMLWKNTAVTSVDPILLGCIHEKKMEKNWRDDIEAQKEKATEYEPDEKTAQQLIKIFIYI